MIRATEVTTPVGQNNHTFGGEFSERNNIKIFITGQGKVYNETQLKHGKTYTITPRKTPPPISSTVRDDSGIGVSIQQPVEPPGAYCYLLLLLYTLCIHYHISVTRFYCEISPKWRRSVPWNCLCCAK